MNTALGIRRRVRSVELEHMARPVPDGGSLLRGRAVIRFILVRRNQLKCVVHKHITTQQHIYIYIYTYMYNIFFHIHIVFPA